MEVIAKDSWSQRARKRAIARHDDDGIALWMRAENDAGNAKAGLALLMRPKGPFPARRS